MADIVTFGEAMVRLSPPNFRRLEQTSILDVNLGGAELNVAVGCARLELESAWGSKLPDNPLGRIIRNKERMETWVSASTISSETKAGMSDCIFWNLGLGPVLAPVWYDRARSSFSTVQPGELNWQEIQTGTLCFHITGITPAVSPSAAEATLEAMRQARSAGCKVSLYLNYRTKELRR
ncbi:MAG: hypothetical protein GY850_39285 [bacterium]|nr:hypothetical protein [bacterium]